jgi:hypothetical protein
MVVLASRNQCERWAAANECVTNAKYSCVCGLLCVLLGSLTILGCVRVCTAGAKTANKPVWLINVGL